MGHLTFRNGKSKCHFLSVRLKVVTRLNTTEPHLTWTKSQGVCCYKGTYKPAGELHAGIVIRTVTTVVERSLPLLLGRGNFSQCYPFPLQRGSRNSGKGRHLPHSAHHTINFI